MINDEKSIAVSNSFRRLVLGLLYTDGPMSESDILKHVEIEQDLLAYHLETLVSANMVEQKPSLYSLTNDGINFLKLVGADKRLDSIKNSGGVDR